MKKRGRWLSKNGQGWRYAYGFWPAFDRCARKRRNKAQKKARKQNRRTK